MANEARINSSLQIRKTSGTLTLLDYASRPSAFQATVTGTKGPSPGAVTAIRTGTVVSFAALTIPGFCRISSLDSDTGNYVEYGIYDPQTDVFYPLGEVGPGESYIIKLSRNLLEEYAGTGTGTTAATNSFMLKAFNASADCLVEAFEK